LQYTHKPIRERHGDVVLPGLGRLSKIRKTSGEQSMAGETDLRKLLLATMTPELRPGVHLFATLPPDAPVPDSLQPVMLFREQQEWYAGKGCASVDRCSEACAMS
jgi:hypothetical protein